MYRKGRRGMQGEAPGQGSLSGRSCERTPEPELPDPAIPVPGPPTPLPPKMIFSPTRSLGSSLPRPFCPPRANRIGKPHHGLESARSRLTTSASTRFLARGNPFLARPSLIFAHSRAGRKVRRFPGSPMWGQRLSPEPRPCG